MWLLVVLAIALAACEEPSRVEDGPVHYFGVANASALPSAEAPPPSLAEAHDDEGSPGLPPPPPPVKAKTPPIAIAAAPTAFVTPRIAACPAKSRVGGPAPFDLRRLYLALRAVHPTCGPSPDASLTMAIEGTGVIRDITVYPDSSTSVPLTVARCFEAAFRGVRVPPFDEPCTLISMRMP